MEINEDYPYGECDYDSNVQAKLQSEKKSFEFKLKHFVFVILVVLVIITIIIAYVILPTY